MSVFEQESGRIIWRGDGETLVVQTWGNNSLRVRSTKSGDIRDTDFALLTQPQKPADITVDGSVATFRNGDITAVLRAIEFYDEQAGYQVFQCAVEYQDAKGKTLLRELPTGGSLKLIARDFKPAASGTHRLKAAFESNPDEKLYGMGQYQQDNLDIKGCAFELAHRNSQASVPFVISDQGYGFLWHNPAIGSANFAKNRTEWIAESTTQLDYWITVGQTPHQISSQYADATGHVPMMPEFGMGYWQCKLRYWNQEQLLQVAREHKRRELPLNVIVADFFHWPKMGDYRFDEEFWPDPAAMVKELQEMGVELMVSIWPQVSVESENFNELKKNNLLVQTERGLDVQMSFQGPSMFLDATNPKARAKVWEICQKNYHDMGVRVFWLDEAEPEYGQYDFDNYRYHAGSNMEVGNWYPQAYSRAFYEGQQQAGQTEIVNLVRCAWAGSQRYGALVWSGDIHSTFEDLRCQITAGIHMGVAGIPWFTTDIGGFHGGDINDPDFHELLIRWFQFATFCPVMRMHGDRKPSSEVRGGDGSLRCHNGADNELWSFGEEVYEILKKYVFLREKLRPYTRQLMEEAHTTGVPIMRGMFYEFPDDPQCRDLADQYMYGPDVLVAPIVQPGGAMRNVYLPSGSTWTEVHAGTEHAGGQTIVSEARLDTIPVFVRNGSRPELIGSI